MIGVQIENELYDQPQHLRTPASGSPGRLGLHAPIWTATGWGGAQSPESRSCRVFGGYGDGFWVDADRRVARVLRDHFRFSTVRDDPGIGADLRAALDGITVRPSAGPRTDDDAVPVRDLRARRRDGHVAYHRRPLVAPADVAAVAPAKIGNGSIWQGYYMYAGGTQRTGPHGSEQESHATGYPNDVPRVTYDFAAPIGEHGQIRPHHHYLRAQHLWLRHDGHRIAAMATTVGGGSADPEVLRWAVRSDGHSGYLFASTYQPAKAALPEQRDVQFTVTLDDGEITVPTQPLTIPAGVSLVWPLRYPIAPDLCLRSATARVLTRLIVEGREVVVLGAYDGIPVELVLDGEHEVGGAGVATLGDCTTIVSLTAPPGPTCVVEMQGTRIIVLDQASIDRLYLLEVDGRERLVLSSAPLYALHGDLVVQTESPDLSISILPAPGSLRADGAELSEPFDAGPWRTWQLRSQHAGGQTLVAGLPLDATSVPRPERGGPLNRLSAPTDFSGAAALQIDVSPDAFDGVDRTLLRMRWSGDVGRAYVGDELISDHFWHGRDWDIDLTPWAAAIARDGVRFELLPWKRSTGVWVDPAVREIPEGVHVAAVDVVRVGQVRLTSREP